MDVILTMDGGFVKRNFFLPNVPDHLPPLAFGTKGCSAADVPKVPKAWWLSASVCSDYYF